ncbi:MAG: [Fe-S]-binding protein [Candidatus Rokubacteria bacterium]|nr:[Fe-S]-binding protein [Candidatus Rokubacteria bacterium]
MDLPKMLRVRQSFPRPRVNDIPRAVGDALGRAGLAIKRGDTVAVGAGSRGVANVDVIVGATVRWLRDAGARPFVFPAMGSHGGGTADGQLDVLAHYGITEQTMGCPVRATMDVVQVGEALGMPVWLDRHAAEADAIGIVNRVKPHTDFKGEIESGLFKMMTIGLGKYRGAVQYHRMNVTHGYEKVITAVGREMLARARIGFGLAILENGYDETAHVEAFTAGELEAGERRLLEQAREWMMRLPFRAIDVLVVEEMGKNISGSGMDTNVIGRPSNPHEPFPTDQKILWVVVLDLTEQSYGNAVGIGNADFTTRRLVDKIDMKPTLINAITACAPNGAKVPATFDTDREAIETALGCIGLTPPDRARVVRIKNTLKLGEVEVSEAYADEVRRRPDLEVLGDPAPLAFDAAGQLIPS